MTQIVIIMNKIKEQIYYFIYHPDKIETNIQVNILNPIFNFISDFIFMVIGLVRSLLMWVLKLA